MRDIPRQPYQKNGEADIRLVAYEENKDEENTPIINVIRIVTRRWGGGRGRGREGRWRTSFGLGLRG